VFFWRSLSYNRLSRAEQKQPNSLPRGAETTNSFPRSAWERTSGRSCVPAADARKLKQKPPGW